ncbi:DExH-box ATP-dependent RNA helicase DExH3 [Camellia lanceoleosa]|nr:DExH-box ATP-dependent RNA helicase DExH3 [Camellia lanceoleosa]
MSCWWNHKNSCRNTRREIIREEEELAAFNQESVSIFIPDVYMMLLQIIDYEILRTPLQSLCLQIKSLKLASISEFLSRAFAVTRIISGSKCY